MKKTAVVYDKWLSSLGGGEVVACNIAKALIDSGYKTTFVSGKLVEPDQIKDKLGIDISKAEFKEIWDDEAEIKKITKNVDLYVNASFMDYSTGSAKKNIFYTSFPTEAYSNLKGKIFSNLIIPILLKTYKSSETLTLGLNESYRNGHKLVKINPEYRVAFPNLKINKKYIIKFILYLEDFSKSNLESLNWSVGNAKIINQKLIVDHHHSTIKVRLSVENFKNTLYLSIKKRNNINNNFYIIEPQIGTNNFVKFYPKYVREKIDNRIRAGFYNNLINRMSSFDIIFANSLYTKKWIKKFWKRESRVLYPPVSLIKRQKSIQKENYICSVGRFFTLGHGKKQEVLIEAFKNMCKQGLTGWELHLAGGLGNEPSSQEFVKTIEKSAKGYPVHFHYNKPKSFIENLYNSSKIYWHAAGYGENKNKDPIKFEHFGIAPIEAISANCLPVLFNGGGLPDTINSLNLKSEQYLFNTIPELIDKTNYLISNYQAQFKIFRNTQTELTKLYDEKVFRKKFIKQLNVT